jgi:hypothetical protein
MVPRDTSAFLPIVHNAGKVCVPMDEVASNDRRSLMQLTEKIRIGDRPVGLLLVVPISPFVHAQFEPNNAGPGIAWVIRRVGPGGWTAASAQPLLRVSDSTE